MIESILTGFDTVVLNGHFGRAAAFKTLIDREMLLAKRDAGKVMPWIEFRNLVCGGSGPLNSFHHAFFRATFIAEDRIRDIKEVTRYEAPLSLVSDDYADRYIPYFWDNYERHTKESSSKHVAEQVKRAVIERQAKLKSRQGVLNCARVADMLESYEMAMMDEEFRGLTLKNLCLGNGEGVLRFWQALNAVPSWNNVAKRVTNIEDADKAWPRPSRVMSPVF